MIRNTAEQNEYVLPKGDSLVPCVLILSTKFKGNELQSTKGNAIIRKLARLSFQIDKYSNNLFVQVIYEVKQQIVLLVQGCCSNDLSLQLAVHQCKRYGRAQLFTHPLGTVELCIFAHFRKGRICIRRSSPQLNNPLSFIIFQQTNLILAVSLTSKGE